MKNYHYAVYAALVILNVALSAFNQQLGAGQVPLPHEWSWIIPILSAVIVAATMLLPKLGDEPKA